MGGAAVAVAVGGKDVGLAVGVPGGSDAGTDVGVDVGSAIDVAVGEVVDVGVGATLWFRQPLIATHVNSKTTAFQA